MAERRWGRNFPCRCRRFRGRLGRGNSGPRLSPLWGEVEGIFCFGKGAGRDARADAFGFEELECTNDVDNEIHYH